jgi:hypothetical protein
MSEARRLKRRPPCLALHSRLKPKTKPKPKTIPGAARLLSQINAERSHHLLAFPVPFQAHPSIWKTLAQHHRGRWRSVDFVSTRPDR